MVGDNFCFLASKIDPRFLLLPFLEKKDKYSPMDQIIPYIEGCAKFPLQWIADWRLQDICDINDSFGDDMLLYRLNKDKTLQWLRAKVDAAARVFAAKRADEDAQRNRMKVAGFQASSSVEPSGAPGSVSENAANGGSSSGVQTTDTKLALQVVLDYIGKDLSERLTASYGVCSAEVLATKAAPARKKTDWEEELELEKDKAASISMTGGRHASELKRPAPKKPSSASKTAKTAKKAAVPLKGMQGITSFFSKK